jgi:transcriptional regulator with XRE-family HTH domain
MNNLGTKIKKIRELKDYTQEYMASSLGITITGYGKIERNESEITVSKLQKIAKILDVDYRQILDFDEKQIFNIQNGDNAAIGNNQIYHNDKMIEHLQNEILHLRNENSRLLGFISK